MSETSKQDLNIQKLLRDFQKPKLPSSVRKQLEGEPLEEPEGLTDAQEKFATLVAMGSTLIEAFKKSYSWEGYQNKNLYNKAYSTVKTPKIAARIDQILRERERVNVHESARLRAFVVERLQQEAMNTKNNGSSRVRALELIGRMDQVGLFAPLPEDKVKASNPGDLLKDIEGRLTKILANKRIDAVAEKVIEELDTPEEKEE
jgi:hypothetical protein